jgi:DNA-binding response OmpR family regulator
MKRRILVVEDDPKLTRILRDNLSFEGFEVECAADGHAAVDAVQRFAPDLVVLDVTLPGSNGFELCRTWRKRERIAIVMLTARSGKSDKLRGLELGADDYITKPFDLPELLARIRAVLRRVRPTIERLALGEVNIDFVSRLATRGGVRVDLKDRDFEILHYLAERSGAIVRRLDLIREVWGYPEAVQTRAVDNAVARLRRKIEADAHHPKFLHTVYGDGYRLTIEGAGH